MGKLESDQKQPCLGWRQGSVTPVCQWQPMPHNVVYPSSTCVCALVRDATALARLHLGFWFMPKTKIAYWRGEKNIHVYK